MNIFIVGLHKLSARWLNSLMTLLLFGLGVSIISLLLIVNHQFERKLKRNIEGIGMVVGAKGSPLQLILSSVYHIDDPTGNIKISETKLIRKSPFVKKAIPLSYGDSYQGLRIVGTTPAYPEHYEAEIDEGRFWEKPMEAVIGSDAAKKTGMKIGDLFVGSHGLTEGGDHHHDHEYKVVGILDRSNSVIDNLILTDLRSVWEVHKEKESHLEEGHEHDEHSEHEEHANHDDHAHDGESEDHSEHDDHSSHNNNEHEEHGDHDDHDHDEGENHSGHDDHAHDGDEDHSGHDHGEHAHEGHNHESGSVVLGQRTEGDILEELSDDPEAEITSMIVKFGSPRGALSMPRTINTETNMQAAVPAYEADRLFKIMGLSTQALQVLALVIIIISGLSVFISLYNSLRERRYEMALMRVTGATRLKLFLIIIIEGTALSVLGFFLGIIMSHAGMYVLSTYLEDTYRFSFSAFVFLPGEILLLPGALLIGALASVLPAIQASGTDISRTLSEH